MTANHAMALRVVWGTRVDDDTPAPDARELLEMCGLVERGGHEILPDIVAGLHVPNIGKSPAGDLSPQPVRRPADVDEEPRPRNVTTPPGLRDLPPTSAPAKPRRQTPAPTLAVAADPPAPAESLRAGGAYIAALQGRELGVDHTYQRPLEQARVNRMVAAWDPRMVGVVDVSDRGAGEHPRYAVINGQHRAAAAAQASGLGPAVWLVCNVHEGLTVADEARLMHELDRGTKKLSGHDQWRARRIAGDDQVVAVERVAARHGLQVGPAPVDGVVRSYGTAEKLLKLGGEELLDQALAVLRGAYDTAAAGYQAPLFMAVGQLLHGCADLDVPRLTRTLAAHRPEQLRAAATMLRDELPGPLHALMATAIADAYNRTPGSGSRISWSR